MAPIQLVDLSSILSSQARFRVIQALALLSGGMGLRELERHTQLQIRSVQVAVSSLMADRILIKGASGLLRLNPKSQAASPLRGLFRYLRNESLQARARSLSTRAQWTLQLSDEVGDLLRRSRRRR